MGSGITLTETDPSDILAPDAGKDTIFMDSSVSPPAPAYKDSSDVTYSLIGPQGPTGPAGPTGSITVNPNGALDGDGSGGSPLGVRVDNVTIGINASNELEALGAGSGTVVNDATLTAGKTVVGNGTVHVTVSALTADIVDSAAGTLGAVSVGTGLQKSGGVLSAKTDNETIGVDSNGKLEVLQRYVAADANLTLEEIVIGQGGTHVRSTSTPNLGTPSAGILTNCEYAGKLLALTNYNPNTLTDTSTTSTSGVDVDATNLTITFTVPATGKVLVSMCASGFIGGVAAYWWTLRDTSGNNIAGTRRRVTPAVASEQTSCTSRVYVTGLTPGASVTYRWGHGVSANTGHIRYGDDGGTDPYGAAVMEVWAAP